LDEAAELILLTLADQQHRELMDDRRPEPTAASVSRSVIAVPIWNRNNTAPRPAPATPSGPDPRLTAVFRTERY
jgi:hypothetical protein